MFSPVCQVGDPSLRLGLCSEREGGGIRCEVVGPHEDHWVSEHTIEHSLSGNGYSCDSFVKLKYLNGSGEEVMATGFWGTQLRAATLDEARKWFPSLHDSFLEVGIECGVLLTDGSAFVVDSYEEWDAILREVQAGWDAVDLDESGVYGDCGTCDGGGCGDCR